MSFVRVAILKHGLTVWDKALVPSSEVERRLRATRALMEQNGWTALIAYSDQLHCGNVAYLTNFQSYEPRHPALAVVTGDSLDLIPKVAARDLIYIRRYAFADEVHECEYDLAESLATVAELRGLKDAKIAFDGAAAAPGPVALAMKSVFAPGALSDATEHMLQMRRAKSAAERTLMMVAAGKAESVLASLREFVRPGMSELEAGAFADYAARSEGCMDTDFLVLREPRFPFVPAEARILADGTHVNVYLALQFHGYWIEISESLAVGEPRAAQVDGRRLARAYLQEALDEAAVGAPASDGRYLWIHGIGLDREEPPYSSRLKQPDAPGDVLGVHAAVERDGALFVCGRSVAVVEGTRRILGLSLHVALDIGGTFTDLVAIDDDTGELRHAKSSTTPEDLTVGIARCLAKSGVDLERSETFVHGATVAINTLVEHTGARTVLLTTQGARDVYLIGRGNRPEAYNVFFQRPVPLVRRGMILEVAERMAAAGTPILALTEEAIADACARVARMEPESVAVCLLHAYANPVHEQQLGAALRKALPGVYVSLSHEILRQYREYERTSTTVVNSYVGPKVERYLHRLESELAAKRFGGSLLIMQPNGGVTSVAGAARAPVALMESGPVGGINAAAQIGARLGFPQVISFDMGGTTAKASLIRDGEPAIAEGYYVGGYAGGHPVMLPVVDIIEVGAGGGSIAWIDEVGALKVGPRSAGAAPGPACYGTGGEDPTVTDANVLLGRINPAAFLDGEMQLDVAGSRAAIERRLCGALGRDVIEVALGIIRIAVAHMTLAVRGISIERGFDPRDFVMLVSGGNGGLHGPLIARELGIPKVIVPVLPAHGSALGMLMTDIRHDYVSTQTFPLRTLDFAAIRTVCDEFRRAGLQALEEEGVAAAQQEVRLSFDLRYVGQEYSLNVPVPEADLAGADRDAIRARYNALHQRTYGQSSPSEEAEVVNVRVSVHGRRKKFGVKNDSAPAATAVTTRPVYVDDPRAPVNVTIYRRATLPPGSVVEGPAILEDSASTVLLLARDRAVILETGEIMIDIGV